MSDETQGAGEVVPSGEGTAQSTPEEQLKTQLADRDRQINELVKRSETMEQRLNEITQPKPAPVTEVDPKVGFKQVLSKAFNDGDLDAAADDMAKLDAAKEAKRIERENKLYYAKQKEQEILQTIDKTATEKPHLTNFKADIIRLTSDYIGREKMQPEEALAAATKYIEDKLQPFMTGGNTMAPTTNPSPPATPAPGNPSPPSPGSTGFTGYTPPAVSSTPDKVQTNEEYMAARRDKAWGRKFGVKPPT